jgi:exodeoxyribonuclease V alpha subunit
VRLVDGLVHLERYWQQERTVAAHVDAALAAPVGTPDADRLAAAADRLFPGAGPDRQRLAAVVAAHRRFAIVAGGPGTGKTTTVAKLLAMAQDLADRPLRVALAAPTGKAAARLTEAVAEARAALHPGDRAALGSLSASTLHRLLGSRHGQRTRFRHDRDNRLPHDVVVVDEASMVSLTLMARLVEALRPHARLVLVGDPDQLSSVEVGAVLGDLAARPSPADAVRLPAAVAPPDVAALSLDEQERALAGGVVRLSEVHRFSGDIQELAGAVRVGDLQAIDAILDRGSAAVELVEPAAAGPTGTGTLPASVLPDVVEAGVAMVRAAREGSAEDALAALERHRVLCGHREGPWGVGHWSGLVESALAEAVPGYTTDGAWYVGRPLLVTANDYAVRLFNGDTGVVVAEEGRPRAAFRRDGRLDTLPVSRLTAVQSVPALSGPRSPGSQIERVTLVLPPAGSRLLTRELVYTAVTRAKEHVRIIGTRDALAEAVGRPVQRASGLRRRASGP